MIKKEANYISVKDLAELVDVSEKTIRREITDNILKAIKVRNILRIHKKDALDWLEKKEYIKDGTNE